MIYFCKFQRHFKLISLLHWSCWTQVSRLFPHLVKQLLQLLLQLSEVAGGNQAFLGLVQTVSEQLHQLVLDEAQHPVSQREGAVWRAVGDNLKQALLHLGRGLQGQQPHKHTVKTLKDSLL